MSLAPVLPLLLSLLKRIGMYLLQAVLSEIFIKEFIIYALQKLANKTDNTVDDRIVNALKKAMGVYTYEEEFEVQPNEYNQPKLD